VTGGSNVDARPDHPRNVWNSPAALDVGLSALHAGSNGTAVPCLPSPDSRRAIANIFSVTVVSRK
jgi:hypothetical protein